LYQTIDPSISKHFHNTFSASFLRLIPIVGLTIGGGLVVFGTAFNFSIPMRFMHFALPVIVDYWFNLRNPKSELATS
jgi:hypothetical protein